MGRCGRRSIIKSSISSRNEEVDDVDMLVFEFKQFFGFSGYFWFFLVFPEYLVFY